MIRFTKLAAIVCTALLGTFITFSSVPNSNATTIIDDSLTGDDILGIDFLSGKVRRGSDHPWGRDHPNTPGSQGGPIPHKPPPSPAVPPQPGWCKSSTIAGVANMCSNPSCTAGYAVDPNTGNVIVHPCTSTGGTGPSMPNSCQGNNSSHAAALCKSCASGIVSWKNGGNVVLKKCPPKPKKTSFDSMEQDMEDLGLGDPALSD